MDFFHQQDRARKNTKWLIALYVLAVVMIVLVVNFIIAAALQFSNAHSVGLPSSTETFVFFGLIVNKTVFITVSIVMFSSVALASFVKWLSVRKGGSSVAVALGGYVVDPDTDDAQKKQLLNVVEEMALAAGMTVPLCYVLEHEQGINAFAAGYTSADAVIGITQGAMDSFNRDQLQGVIAHEFSHILNGDMRINMRLISLLHGIVFIRQLGRFFMQGSYLGMGMGGMRRKSRGDHNKVAILGLVLFVLGGLGSLFAHLIKAAVNRQREFLADASAVQFTRNPLGISQALQIIGSRTQKDIVGSTIRTHAAEEYSHLFFGQALSSLSQLFATHPPLEKRIRRIDRRWNGRFLSVQPSPVVKKAEAQSPDDNKEFESLGRMAVLATVLMPQTVHQQLETPYDAVALIYSMLLDQDVGIRQKQMEFIRQTQIHDLEEKVEKTCELLAQRISPDSYLPMIRAAFPSLKLLTLPQYKVVKKALLLLIKADDRISLQEWVIYQLFRHTLEVALGIVRPSKDKHASIKAVRSSVTLVMSLLAHQSSQDATVVKLAFGKGINVLGLYTATLLPEGECDDRQFFAAAQQLSDCYPLVKEKILKGFRACIENDGETLPAEEELLAGLAAMMDVVLPEA